MAKSESTRRLWTNDEAIAALAIYCQLPFGQMHTSTPAVRELARKIKRTPSAVALKLANFASFDPEHQQRGVKGMQHSSKLDREVWDTYFGNWDLLSRVGVDELGEADSPTETTECANTYAMTLIQTRRGQGFFRKSVLAAYGSRCCITGLEAPELIRASHIVPWATDVGSRLDPRNGLALNALHDAAFDRGLITLDNKFKVVTAKALKDVVEGVRYAQFFGQYEGREIDMPERFGPRKTYLDHHRNYIFQN